jgi:peptide/nickel transport system permease protein
LLAEPTGLAGALVIAVVAVVALAAPWIAPGDPVAQNIMNRLQAPVWRTHDRSHLLGTDGLGRDILSRIIYGARISLVIGVTAVAIAATLGVALGVAAGYYGGGPDMLIMRVGDIQLSMPGIVLYLAVIAVLGPGLVNLILLLGVTGWVEYARLVRGQVLSVKERDFVEAATALGARDRRILLRHIVPNVLSSIVIMTSLQVGRTILAAAGLSFLGLGVQPPTPDWGVMVGEGLESLERAWWVSTLPGAAILVTVLGTNTLGDWLRDYLDPQSRK